jgi:hypothetical protein
MQWRGPRGGSILRTVPVAAPRGRGENLSPGGPLSGDGPHPGTRAPPGRVWDHCVTTGTSNIEANKSDSASDLRNHHAIVQPAARLYDCVMVTQITLQVNPEPLSHRDPTGSIPARDTPTEKFPVPPWRLDTSSLARRGGSTSTRLSHQPLCSRTARFSRVTSAAAIAVGLT